MGRRLVSHRIIHFLDRRWGFVHRLQAGAFAFSVAIGIVAVSALATQATATIERSDLSNASSTKQDSVSTSQVSQTQLPTGPLPTISEIPVSETPAAKSDTSSAKKALVCDAARLNAAKTAQARALNREASRHRHVVRSLQSTGLITRFFNPNMYSHRLSNEKIKHADILKSIHAKFSNSLAQAHCNS